MNEQADKKDQTNEGSSAKFFAELFVGKPDKFKGQLISSFTTFLAIVNFKILFELLKTQNKDDLAALEILPHTIVETWRQANIEDFRKRAEELKKYSSTDLGQLLKALMKVNDDEVLKLQLADLAAMANNFEEMLTKKGQYPGINV